MICDNDKYTTLFIISLYGNVHLNYLRQINAFSICHPISQMTNYLILANASGYLLKSDASTPYLLICEDF